MGATATILGEKRLNALKEVDRMPADLRQCVHEFGLPIVSVFTKHGITNPRKIREIVREIWLGARQTGQTAGARNALDVLLAREAISFDGLMRLLADNNLAIVPMSPSRAMLDASMAEVSGHNVVCTREEKHRRRLVAAIRAGAHIR